MVMLSLTSTIATAQKFMCLKIIDFNANYRFPAKHMDVFNNLKYFNLKFWTFYSSRVSCNLWDAHVRKWE